MILGLDFDNTLVRYDELFHQLAIEKKLIEETLPANKIIIRNYLRGQGKDEQFTLLQGEVYGRRILEAKPAEGMLKTLTKLGRYGVQMKLVSHKTKTPYKGPSYDLHLAAWTWLERHDFFESQGIGWKREDVYFEETKTKKINKIKELKCTHYIDDLEEILKELPEAMQRILYSPNANKSKRSEPFNVLKHWEELNDVL